MKATKPEQISAPLTGLTQQLGLTTWFAGSLVHESELDTGFGFYCGSPEWSRHYTAERYCLIDPIFLAAKETESPIRWMDLTRRLEREKDKTALRVMNEAREFRIYDGFTKAWHGDVPGCVTFGGESPNLSREARMSLLLVGAFAYEGFRRVVQGFKPVSPVLTQREADVLHWTAEGKTAWEIGAILSIAERTVRCYLDQLKRKYNVPTVMQVVVRAMLDGNLSVPRSTRHI
jgi:LuxR family quorum sensing-dependent transcriptional regulator